MAVDQWGMRHLERQYRIRPAVDARWNAGLLVLSGPPPGSTIIERTPSQVPQPTRDTGRHTQQFDETLEHILRNQGLPVEVGVHAAQRYRQLMRESMFRDSRAATTGRAHFGPQRAAHLLGRGGPRFDQVAHHLIVRVHNAFHRDRAPAGRAASCRDTES
ncbi:hypothetical protein OG300_39350 [Nocardia sp. NBC_00511]